MIEEVQINPLTGNKNVENKLFIERKDKYLFYLELAVKSGRPAKSYVFSNDDISKQGVNDLIAYMNTYSLENEEWWEGNTYTFTHLYIGYISPYFFELRGVYSESEIPTYEKVFVSDDVSEWGLQALLNEFLSWYNAN